MKHGYLISLDLETEAIDPHARVLSIGACLMSPDGRIINSFYTNVNCDNNYHFVSSKEVLEWWAKQNPELILNMSHKRRSPVEAAIAFREWVLAVKVAHASRIPLISNGVDFDKVILQHLFKVARIEWPFHYRENIDLPSYKELLGEDNIKKLYTIANEYFENQWGEFKAHDALCDSIYQAYITHMILEKITVLAC